ncbi:MAG: molybdate ABC transporter substrate-binding protein [Nostoc sp. NOS(2021)]|uniref:molybdate ABC transporter substrate-binding protein n=1 Tax=Nostoc sp. NOS(2021) TaxID=2815407 RepID=UPI0025EDC76C|nr:molybdate ABC transporter substrate-binding protein [Nostoc sp. NOS(2021)]MBN3896979.1 molybdate ABC transporter substrate-binding protein [Nostoc sp. NOS(2021)]
MKKRYKLALATASIALGFGVIQAKPAQAATLSSPININIYAAASLTDTLLQVQTLYQQSNPDVTFTDKFAGSIGLANEIIMGKNPNPVDIFFSVSQAPLDNLQSANQLKEGTRQDILNNTLAIITPINSTISISSVKDLLPLNKVAIGNPASVPAGVFAQQLFANFGISGQLNLVLGTDVRDVLSLVSNNTVDAGIVYTTDALTALDKVKIAYTPPINLYSPIVYGSAVLTQTQNLDAAKNFNSFLRSPQALSVFQVSGFTPIPEPMTTGGSIAVGIVGLMMKRKVAAKAKAKTKAAVD